MVSTMTLHAGAKPCSREQLDEFAVPEATQSYHPVPHGEFIDRVLYELPRFDFEQRFSRFAATENGNRMFAIIDLTRKGLPESEDYGVALGLRNAYDRSMSLGGCAGSRVWLCDNLAMHGETMVTRRHTRNVWRDLPNMIYNLLQGLPRVVEQMDHEIDHWKRLELTPEKRHHALIRCAENRVFPWSKMPSLHHASKGSENVWAFFNHFTTYAKDRGPDRQWTETLRLTKTFREVFPVPPKSNQLPMEEPCESST